MPHSSCLGRWSDVSNSRRRFSGRVFRTTSCCAGGSTLPGAVARGAAASVGGDRIVSGASGLTHAARIAARAASNVALVLLSSWFLRRRLFSLRPQLDDGSCCVHSLVEVRRFGCLDTRRLVDLPRFGLLDDIRRLAHDVVRRHGGQDVTRLGDLSMRRIDGISELFDDGLAHLAHHRRVCNRSRGGRTRRRLVLVS